MARLGRAQPFKPKIGKPIVDAAAGTPNPVALSAGTMTLAGAALTRAVAYSRVLSAGTMTLAGAAINAAKTGNNAVTLAAGTMTLAGAAITAAVDRPRTLSAGTMTLSGAALTAVVARNRTLDAGTMSLAGAAITVAAPSTSAAIARGKTGPQAGPFRGPHERASTRRQWIVRDTRRQEEEARKAMQEALAALAEAQATTAAARTKAVQEVFRKLAQAGAETAALEAREAIDQAQTVRAGKMRSDAITHELAELRRFMQSALDEMNELRRKRRHEEEEHLVRFLLLS